MLNSISKQPGGFLNTLFPELAFIEKHLAWKVLRDPLYNQLYEDNCLKEDFKLQYLYDAGFFQDRFESPEEAKCVTNISQFTTPVDKILNNIGCFKGKCIVLLSTGGLSPIHHGHISMMEAAKERLEKDGHKVVGGYLSPSHDDYVSTKHGGEAKLSAAHRVHLCQLAVKDSNWLMIDPWEAQYVPTDINFTDVVLRLQSYLNKYLPDHNLEIWYICGADNWKFSRVFEKYNGCVVVGREGHACEVIETNNIKYTQNVSTYANYSSTAARRWRPELMPSEVSQKYFKWKKNILSADCILSKNQELYLIRDDWFWSLAPWIQTKITVGMAEKAKNKFKQGLSLAIRNAFQEVSLPDLPVDLEIRTYGLRGQAGFVTGIRAQESVLNLDVCTNGGQGLNLSRKFSLADGQISSRQLIPRPGYPEIDEQINQIQPGKYTLIDDDIATGNTINMVMGLLPESVEITKIRTLMDFSRKKYHENNLGTFDPEPFDVIDLRDFILGTKDGGLVMSLPSGELVRVPYLLPYVSLISRASIPPSSETKLSKEIIRLNIEFFNNLEDRIKVGDFDEYSKKFFLWLGYTENTSPLEILKEWLNG